MFIHIYKAIISQIHLQRNQPPALQPSPLGSRTLPHSTGPGPGPGRSRARPPRTLPGRCRARPHSRAAAPASEEAAAGGGRPFIAAAAARRGPERPPGGGGGGPGPQGATPAGRCSDASGGEDRGPLPFRGLGFSPAPQGSPVPHEPPVRRTGSTGGEATPPDGFLVAAPSCVF